MDNMMQKAGLALLAIAAIVVIAMWISAALTDAVAAVMIFAILGGSGLLLAQAVKDRVSNEEDNYYSKNVEK